MRQTSSYLIGRLVGVIIFLVGWLVDRSIGCRLCCLSSWSVVVVVVLDVVIVENPVTGSIGVAIVIRRFSFQDFTDKKAIQFWQSILSINSFLGD